MRRLLSWEEAKNRLSHAVEIPLKIAELNMRIGDLALSEECLKKYTRSFSPTHPPCFYSCLAYTCRQVSMQLHGQY